MQIHLIKNETKAGPTTRKEQNNGPLIEPDLEESLSRREQLKTQKIEEKRLESLFFIPQDFSTKVPTTIYLFSILDHVELLETSTV